MKINEAIKNLQDIVDLHGDLEIYPADSIRKLKSINVVYNYEKDEFSHSHVMVLFEGEH